MIKETIAKLESQIENSPALPSEKREELMRLLETLKEETNQLTDTHPVRVDPRAHPETSPELLRHSMDELTESAAKFEKSHPRLFQAAQSITNTLSNIGI